MSTSGQTAQPHLYGLGGVDVFSWDPVRASEDVRYGRTARNFGDVLGRILVERIVGRLRISLDRTPDATHEPRTLLAVGSIMHFAPPGATIWGTGVNYKVPKRVSSQANTLDVRAVRGPITARMLERSGCVVPPVYGDPILLLPEYFPELGRWMRAEGPDVLVVPNLNDYPSARQEAEALGFDILDPTAPTEHVLRRIVAANFVIGSSLHAVVVADAMGIPARFVQSTGEHILKYRDYLAGSGRPATIIADTIADALRMGGHEAPRFSPEELIAAFPTDLWEAAGPSVTAASSEASPPSRDGSRWDALIDAPSVDAMKETSTTRMVDALARLRERAELRLTQLQGEEGASTDAAPSLTAGFEEACLTRVTDGSCAEVSTLTDADADLLSAVDEAHVDLALRAVWLEHAGPHALGRVTADDAGAGATLFLSLRPGRMTNHLDGWRLRRGDEVVCELPVFDIHNRQWAMEASLPWGSARFEDLYVDFRRTDGDWMSVPVRAANNREDRLTAFPVIGEVG